MKDKRMVKIKQHYEIFINDRKFKVISCKIDEGNRILSINTKIFGQKFPQNGRIAIRIPSENLFVELTVSFRFMGSNPALEHWEYLIIRE